MSKFLILFLLFSITKSEDSIKTEKSEKIAEMVENYKEQEIQQKLAEINEKVAVLVIYKFFYILQNWKITILLKDYIGNLSEDELKFQKELITVFEPLPLSQNL